MRLLVMSDLHLETVRYPHCLRPEVKDYDVLIAAGDIWENETARGFEFLRKLAKEKPIIAVLGNHEHWKKEVISSTKKAKSDAKKYDVTLLEGEETEIDGIRFFGCTLWTDYQLAGALDEMSETGEDILVKNKLKNGFFTIQDSINLHRKDREKLEKFISQDDGTKPLVVVTHHAPHPGCLPPTALNTWRAGNAASDLSHLTDTGRIALWVHGHTHFCIDMIRPGGTRIVSNAAGTKLANPDFNENFIVKI